MTMGVTNEDTSTGEKLVYFHACKQGFVTEMMEIIAGFVIVKFRTGWHIRIIGQALKVSLERLEKRIWKQTLFLIQSRTSSARSC